MKKLLALILALTMCLCLFSACSDDKDNQQDADQTVTEDTQTGEDAAEGEDVAVEGEDAATEDTTTPEGEETTEPEPVDPNQITPADVEKTLSLCYGYHDASIELIEKGKEAGVAFYPELIEKVEYQTIKLKDYENVVVTEQHKEYTVEELETFNAKLRESLEILIGAHDELSYFIREAANVEAAE